MAGRSWTVVVVPKGSAAPRTLEITERGVKRTPGRSAYSRALASAAIAVDGRDPPQQLCRSLRPS